MIKKRIAAVFLTSLISSVILGCTDRNAANTSDLDESSILSSVSDDQKDQASSDSSHDLEIDITKDMTGAESSTNVSSNLIDDESTALISSSEDSLYAAVLFDELITDPDSSELDESQLETLQKGISDCKDNKFIGSWERTYVAMGMSATITIEAMSDNSCVINGDFLHYGNTGTIKNVTGYYLSANMMYAVDEECNTVYLFKVSDESMDVRQKGFGCMGGNVTSNGTYVTGKPEYINEYDIEFAFTEDELTAIKELLDQNSLDYEEYFETAILYGIFETSQGNAVFDDGSLVSGRWFTSYAPHGFTRNLNLFISDDGAIYFESGYNPHQYTTFITTDSNASSMPSKESDDN